MGISRLVGVDRTYRHSNALGATIVYALPMVWPVWYLATKRWHYALLIGYVVLSITCLLLTGSRSSLLGLIFLALLASVFTRHRVKVLSALAVAALLILGTMQTDLQHRYLTIVDSSAGPENAKVSADARWTYFCTAVELWKDNPVFGVGIRCFPQASGTKMSSHSIYAELLGEVGIVGILAFAVLIWAFFANSLAAFRRAREVESSDRFPARVAQAAGFATIAMLVIGLGQHNLLRYNWLYLGAFQALAIHCMVHATEQETEAYL